MVLQPVPYLQLDLVSDLAEPLQHRVVADLLVAAGVLEDPRESGAHPREGLGAAFLGASAHDDQVIEELLAQVGPQALRVLVRDVYADLAHGLDCPRVDLVCRVYARAHNLEAVPGQMAQQPFGHLAPRRVVGAQEQHLPLTHRYPPPFTSSACTRSLIRSLTERKTAKRSSSEPSAREGSSKDQCSLLWAPGKNGHASLASSQTVITLSKGSCRYLSRVFDSCPEMSMPISAITLMASGLTCVASVPALIASKRSLARCLSSPSAICERAELWVHKNRTLAFFVTGVVYALRHGVGLKRG